MATRKEYNLIDLAPAVENVKNWFDECWSADPGMAVKVSVQLLIKQGNTLENSAHTIAQWAIDNGYFDEDQLKDVEKRVVETYNADVKIGTENEPA